MVDVGLFNLMGLNDDAESPAALVTETVRQVRAAEDEGFDAAWFAEHHGSDFSVCPAPLSMAGACATATKRIALGPAVVVAPFYHPLRLVEEIGLLEALSDGRALVTIGNGHQPPEFKSLGIPMAERAAIMLETWDILDMGLATGRVEYEGRHWRVPATDIALRPKNGRKIPIFVAGHEPQVLARGTRSGAKLFISQGHRTLEAARKMRADLDKIYRQAGGQGTLPLAVQRYAFPTRDRTEARRAAEGLLRFIRRMVALRSEAPARRGIHVAPAPFPGEPTVEWLLENAPIGDPERVAAMLAEEVADLGMEHLTVYMTFAPLDADALERTVRLFGSAVLPALKKASARRPPPKT